MVRKIFKILVILICLIFAFEDYVYSFMQNTHTAQHIVVRASLRKLLDSEDKYSRENQVLKIGWFQRPSPLTDQEIIARLQRLEGFVRETFVQQLIRIGRYPNQEDRIRQVILPYMDRGEIFINSIRAKLIASPEPRSYLYSRLNEKEASIVESALPDLIRNKEGSGRITITVKSLGVGANGHELYQTARMIIKYLMENGYEKLAEEGRIEIRLFGYDKTLSKLILAEESVNVHLEQLPHVWRKCIDGKYFYADLSDEAVYEVLLRDKADIIFCRTTWIGENYNWDEDRYKKFIGLLKSNVNNRGVIIVTNIRASRPVFPNVREIVNTKVNASSI